MYLEEYGNPEGSPIFFLHGSMVSGWMWRQQAEDLPLYRSLIPDFPGFGKSANEKWISLSDTADRIAEVIEERCPESASHVVGLSLGGILALHLAVRHPKTVRSLLVSGVPYGKIPAIFSGLNGLMSKLYSRPRGARLIAKMMGIPRDESMEAFLLTAKQTDPGALKSVTKEISQSPLPTGLEGISTPTLTVAGTRDNALVKAGIRFLSQTISSSCAYFVPNVGHHWNAEKPELFSNMVEEWVGSQSVVEGLLPYGDT